MWHWLHKNVRAVDPLVRTSIIFSVSLHVLAILFFVLLHYLQPTRQLTIQRNAPLTTEITIVIDPHAPVTGVVMHPQKNGNAQEPNKSAITKTEQQKQATTVVSATKAKPHPPLLKLRRTSATPRKSKKQKAKLEKSAKPKKEPTKPKPTSRKAVSEKKVIEQEKPQQPVPAEATKLPVGNEVPLKIDGPIMIARNTSDAAALAVQLEIQEELLRVWRPPVGIDEGVSCTMTVTLDDTGAAQTVEIVKPSGILLFDVSARAAIQQAVWPRAFWGATLELCLQ